MKTYKRTFIFLLVAIFLLLEATVLVAQEKFSVFTGKVVNIRFRKWLDVEGDDKVVMNFRIGTKTVYNPKRYPFLGERVKVEYLTNRGVPVGYTVTILEAK
jgi:hypothetical protein